MKTVYVIIAGLLLWGASATDAKAGDSERKALLGKWEIAIPDAPDGYRKFNAEFKEKDKVVTADLKGGDINLTNQKFTEKDGKFTAYVYVGESVKVTLWFEKKVLKGTADTSTGLLKCKFTKVEKVEIKR